MLFAAPMANESGPLVWLDMEMTGLDPETCVPIEVALVITDGELVEAGSYETVIWQPPAALDRMDPFVRKMHTKNGLLEKVRRSETGVAVAERKMIELLTKHAGYRQGVLAGNSIHQDRRFLCRYFPVFEGMLHYRMVDVSSLKELAKRWYGAPALVDKGEGDHTALADIRASMDELSHYRKVMFKPSAGP